MLQKIVYAASCKKRKDFLALAVLALLIYSCSNSPAPTLQNASPPNPEAPLAFFGKGNASSDMRLEYAMALQDSGLYNFTVENFSEKQMENSIEIRLNYIEEKGKFNGIPVLILKAEFLKNDSVKHKFTIRESSGRNDLKTPWSKNTEKKFRKQVLLKRFLEEAKRVKPQEQEHSEGCNA